MMDGNYRWLLMSPRRCFWDQTSCERRATYIPCFPMLVANLLAMICLVAKSVKVEPTWMLVCTLAEITLLNVLLALLHMTSKKSLAVCKRPFLYKWVGYNGCWPRTNVPTASTRYGLLCFQEEKVFRAYEQGRYSLVFHLSFYIKAICAISFALCGSQISCKIYFTILLIMEVYLWSPFKVHVFNIAAKWLLIEQFFNFPGSFCIIKEIWNIILFAISLSFLPIEIGVRALSIIVNSALWFHYPLRSLRCIQLRYEK